MRTSAVGLTGVAILAFVSLGLPDGVLGVAWPSMRGALGLGMAELGGLLAAAMVGYLVSASASGTLMTRLGIGRLLLVSSLVMTASCLGYAAAPGRQAALGAALLAGLGGGAIDAGINAYAARRFSARLVTWLHAGYGAGAMLGLLLVTAVLASGRSWRLGYAILALALGAMTLAFGVTRTAWDDGAGGTAPTARGGPAAATLGETLASPAVWLNLALFFLYTGLEITAAQWTFSLLTEARGLGVAAAGVAVSAYWASLGIGRVVFGALAARRSPERLLIVSLTLGPAAALLLWWGPLPAVGIVAVASLGFAFAPVFPLLVASTPARVGDRYATQAVGLQVALAYLGTAALPAACGGLATRLGLEAIPAFLVAGTTALGVLYGLGRSRRAALAVPSVVLREPQR